MNRRGFFTRISAAVALVALAPSLAFRRTIEKPKVVTFWLQTECHSRCVDEEFMKALHDFEVSSFRVQQRPFYDDFMEFTSKTPGVTGKIREGLSEEPIRSLGERLSKAPMDSRQPLSSWSAKTLHS